VFVEEGIYRELQQRLDMYSIGFPATESGIEIKILKELFSVDDAGMFLTLSHRLEEAASLAERLNMRSDEVTFKLEDMVKRGLLFRQRKGGTVRYAAIPFMMGILEFQIKRLSREMSEMFEEYFEEAFHNAISGTEGLLMRTVPVDQSIVMEHSVAAYEDAIQLLKSADVIAVADCICRTEKMKLEKACGKPLEACFVFGSLARYYIENNLGREVDIEEAVSILMAAQDAGLVTQPATTRNATGICNCCGDCCGVLQSIKKHPRPAEIVFSNYQASVVGTECTGCRICLDRCQMEAISLDGSGIAAVDLDRCIGCGLCVTTCPANAMTIFPKPPDKYRVPPENSAAMMMELAIKRGII
jgi:Na+-translocating ferredoxin:NAD+ oxidoreductase subunit B